MGKKVTIYYKFYSLIQLFVINDCLFATHKSEERLIYHYVDLYFQGHNILNEYLFDKNNPWKPNQLLEYKFNLNCSVQISSIS